jgi:hypothetical protein
LERGPFTGSEVYFDAQNRSFPVLRDRPACVAQNPAHGVVLAEDIGDKALLSSISRELSECFQQRGPHTPFVLLVRDHNCDFAFARPIRFRIVCNADQFVRVENAEGDDAVDRFGQR